MESDQEKYARWKKLYVSQHQSPYWGQITDYPIEAFSEDIHQIHEYTDERIIFSQRETGMISIFPTLLIGLLIVDLMMYIRSDSLSTLLMSLPMFIIIGILFILYKRRLDACFVFDRKASTVTFPCGIFPKRVTLDFKDVKAVIKEYFSWGPRSGTCYIYKKDDSIKSIDLLIKSTFKKSWSWIVWYMDSARVLPPGNALDRFRKKNAAELRAENYPEPKYKSTFFIDVITEKFVASVKNMDIHPATIIPGIEDKDLTSMMEELDPEGKFIFSSRF